MSILAWWMYQNQDPIGGPGTADDDAFLAVAMLGYMIGMVIVMWWTARKDQK